MQEVLSIDLVGRLRESQSRLLDWQAEENYFIPLFGSYSAGYQGTLILDDEVNKFLSKESQRILLLAGNSGAGKSLYTQGLVTRLWGDEKEGSAIPLWISLPSCKNPEERAIEETLESCGFDGDQIEELRATQRFIFVLDAYDEIRCLKNLFVTNRLNRWSAKVIFTCRHEYLYWLDSFRNLFTPFVKGGLNYAASAVLYVKPFSAEQIEQYVKRYVLTPDAEWKRWECYQKAFDDIPGVKNLIKVPYVLKLAVEALPEISKRFEGETDHGKKTDLTGAVLYDVFVQRWFFRQEKKLKTNHTIPKHENIQAEFWQYAKSLAQLMHEHNISQVFYDSSEENIFDDEVQENPFAQFFDPSQPRVQILQSSCLIRETSPKHYAFMHASLLDYFLTRELYDTAHEKLRIIHVKGKEESPLVKKKNDYFNERLFVKEGGVIQFFVDRVKEGDRFKTEMLERLASSKNNLGNAKGAANGITILVKAGVTFNGADLSRLNMRGADIRGGYFDRANLEGSDLRDVTVAHAWLRQAVLRYCQLEGVNVGEYPSFMHRDEVLSLVYRPDLNRLVTGSGSSVMLWNIETGECLKTLDGHEKTVKSVSMSQNGKVIASGSEDNTVRVWDVESDKLVVLRGHEVTVHGVHLSADGKTVASGSGDGTVRVWNVASGQAVVLRGHTSWITSVNLSADGKTVTSSGWDCTVRVWDVISGQERVLLEHKTPVYCVQMSVDCKTVVSGCKDETVYVWDIASQEAILLRGHQSGVESVCLSADGKAVVSGGGYDENAVRLWNIQGSHVEVFMGHKNSITCVSFSGDGETVASSSEDAMVRIWKIGSGLPSVQQQGHEYDINTVCLSEDAKILAAGGKDNTLQIWDISRGELVVRLRGHKHSINSVCLSANGKTVVSGSEDHTVRVWNVENGQAVVLYGHQGRVRCVYMSCDGKVVVSGSLDKTVRLWDVDSRKAIVLEGHTGPVNSVYLSSDGMTVVSGGDGAVRLWDVANREAVLLQAPGNNAGVNNIHMSADGKSVVASSCNDYAVFVWNVESGVSVARLEHDAYVLSVHLSANGERVISGSSAGSVYVWDVASQSRLSVFHLQFMVSSISVQNESGLVAISQGSSVQLWQQLDELGQSWQLKWSSTYPNTSFSSEGCDVSGSIGLSLANQRFLKQRGVVVDEKSERSSSEMLTQVGRRSGSPLHSPYDNNDNQTKSHISVEFRDNNL